MSISTIQSQLASNESVQAYTDQTATSGSGIFKELVDTVQSVGSTALDVTSSSYLDELSGSNAELIAAQVEIQKEMQITSMISNIEKSKHETKMTPIRNIRVGG